MNVLGIDTSCYTTSIALICDDGRLICDLRRPLQVLEGALGLRQNEAVFAHIRNLPQLLDEARAMVGPGFRVDAVAASTCPRPVAGSYMPVFTAGESAGRQLAAVLPVPFFSTSHQEGHLAAALHSLALDWEQPFLALHLSGGTGELLIARPRRDGYNIEVIGNCDLPPGQFIDRVGVALGLPFPAGPQLEKLAAGAENAAGEKKFRLSGSVRGMNISFSGPESAAQRAIHAGVPGEEIAAAVFDNIGKSLEKAIMAARKETGIENVLLAGGVAANQRIRQRLERIGARFAAPAFASDNACGVALLGLSHFQETPNLTGV